MHDYSESPGNSALRELQPPGEFLVFKEQLQIFCPVGERAQELKRAQEASEATRQKHNFCVIWESSSRRARRDDAGGGDAVGDVQLTE